MYSVEQTHRHAWQGMLPLIITLRPRQNGSHFADDIFKCIFLNENATISLKISLKFVPKVRINNIPALVQIMVWRRPGDKPLSEPMMVSLLTHIYMCHSASMSYSRQFIWNVSPWKATRSCDIMSAILNYINWWRNGYLKSFYFHKNNPNSCITILSWDLLPDSIVMNKIFNTHIYDSWVTANLSIIMIYGNEDCRHCSSIMCAAFIHHNWCTSHCVQYSHKPCILSTYQRSHQGNVQAQTIVSYWLCFGHIQDDTQKAKNNVEQTWSMSLLYSSDDFIKVHRAQCEKMVTSNISL